MRIIAGEFKGRRLETPIGRDVRPTTEKVKEAVFSILMQEIPGSVFADLFAGTGNMGLEAVSRGATRAYLCDASRESINVIRRNVHACKAEDRAIVYAGDYRKTLAAFPEKVDIFFLDPPYKEGLLGDCFEKISEYGLLADGGLIMAEHGKDEELPDEMCGFRKIKERKYGSIVLSIYS